MAELREYIYRIQPTRPEMLTDGPTEQEAEIIKAHFEYLVELAKQDIALLFGRTLTTDSSSFGIVILKAESEQAARQLMLNDPAVKEAVMISQLWPYSIAGGSLIR